TVGCAGTATFRSSVERSDSRADRIGDVDRILVLPEAKHSPTRRPQQFVRLAISLSVALDLRRPVSHVWLGRREMRGASVPEAPVNEHGNAPPSEDDVSGAPQRRLRSEVR